MLFSHISDFLLGKQVFCREPQNCLFKGLKSPVFPCVLPTDDSKVHTEVTNQGSRNMSSATFKQYKARGILTRREEKQRKSSRFEGEPAPFVPSAFQGSAVRQTRCRYWCQKMRAWCEHRTTNEWTRQGRAEW